MFDFLIEDPTISLQLTYNETCPDDYEPRGFVVAPDTGIIMNQDGFSIGEIDTRYHRYAPCDILAAFANYLVLE